MDAINAFDYIVFNPYFNVLKIQMAKSNSRKKWMRAREKCDRIVVGRRGGGKFLLLSVPAQVLYLNFTNKLLIKICLFPGPDYSAPAVLFLIQKQKSVYFPMPFFCVLIRPSANSTIISTISHFSRRSTSSSIRVRQFPPFFWQICQCSGDNQFVT